MKVDKLKHLEVKKLGIDDDDSIEANIAQDSLPFVFDIISRQLYSNPIGSIIREITSNCFDSHKEANVDEAVIIKKIYDEEDEQFYIEFHDFGVGLSPERMETIYMNYFSSTKRDSNEQIGGFGLGSKTPLSYSDMFYITTRFDGIEYFYIFHKGESKPTLEKLAEEETSERNGTVIKIPIKNTEEHHTGNECYLFEKELKSQLMYFDNVYFQGWNVNNQYKVYEGDHFKFRSDIDQSKQIHICIGKVTYPINFNEIKIENRQIPIAVKFEIGEIPVTPSREEIRYNDESKKLINERIILAINEVIEKYNAQNPEIENLREYIDLRNSSPKLTFPCEEGESPDYLILNKSFVDTNFKFKPLSKLNLKKTPKNLFFEYKIVGQIQNGVYKDLDSYYGNTLNDYDSNKGILIDSNERVSKYGAIAISQRYGYRVDIIKKKNVDYNESCKILGLTSKALGKASVILGYSKIIGEIIKSKYKNYSELKPTDEWIEEYKKSIYQDSGAFLRKQAKKVFVRHFMWTSGSDEISEYELVNRTGILIYGFREDKEQLELVSTILECKKSFQRKGKGNYKDRLKACMVIQVSKSCERVIKQNKRARHCSEFFKTKLFKKIATAYLVNNILDKVIVKEYHQYIKFYQDLKEQYTFLREFVSKNNYRTPYREILDKAREVNAFIPNIIQEAENLVSKVKSKKEEYNFPLLNAIGYISLVEEKEVIEYLKFKKVRLNNNFYLKPIQNVNEENSPEEISKETFNEEGSNEESSENNTEISNEEATTSTIETEEHRGQSDIDAGEEEIF